MEHDWKNSRFDHALGSFSRLICCDKRGTCLSARSVGMPHLEQCIDDIRVVLLILVGACARATGSVVAYDDVAAAQWTVEQWWGTGAGLEAFASPVADDGAFRDSTARCPPSCSPT